MAAAFYRRYDHKGEVLYKIAICNLRLGQKELAVKALTDAIKAQPSLKNQIAKDKNFAELQGDSDFRNLVSTGVTAH
jgi:Tfp pilus assembly protein PilF